MLGIPPFRVMELLDPVQRALCEPDVEVLVTPPPRALPVPLRL